MQPQTLPFNLLNEVELAEQQARLKSFKVDASYRSKKRCKHCWGKGYISIQSPGQEEVLTYCQCIK